MTNLHKRYDWTDANIGKAARLWNSGKSAQEVADIMGTTRQSIINKANRAKHLFMRKGTSNPGAGRRKVASETTG